MREIIEKTDPLTVFCLLAVSVGPGTSHSGPLVERMGRVCVALSAIQALDLECSNADSNMPLMMVPFLLMLNGSSHGCIHHSRENLSPDAVPAPTISPDGFASEI